MLDIDAIRARFMATMELPAWGTRLEEAHEIAQDVIPALCDEVERLRQDPELLFAEWCEANDAAVSVWRSSATKEWRAIAVASERGVIECCGATRRAAEDALWQAIQEQGAPDA